LTEQARRRLLAQAQVMADIFRANEGHRTRVAELRRLNVPALLLHGERTGPAERRMTEILAGYLPQGRLASIPGAGHQSPYTHPGPVAALLRAHFEAAEGSEVDGTPGTGGQGPLSRSVQRGMDGGKTPLPPNQEQGRGK
jgi:hypothetical protein